MDAYKAIFCANKSQIPPTLPQIESKAEWKCYRIWRRKKLVPNEIFLLCLPAKFIQNVKQLADHQVRKHGSKRGQRFFFPVFVHVLSIDGQLMWISNGDLGSAS